jgi:hypothetical protein
MSYSFYESKRIRELRKFQEEQAERKLELQVNCFSNCFQSEDELNQARKLGL